MRTWASVAIAFLAAGTVWAERPDLSGTVVAPDQTALEGATVYVWTAAVKEGTSPYCPSCYPDCGKKAVSDGEGRFKIPSLDPALRFRLLAVKEGFLPTFADSVDPAGEPVVFVLGEISESRREPGHTISGRVVDPEGNPIVGVTVEPFGMKTERGSRYGGMRDVGVDPIAVTNAQGEFTLTSETANRTFYARISARGFATKKVHTLTAGSDTHQIALDRGATVAGYLRHNGEGLGGVEVGMAQTDRSSHTFLGDYSVGTFDSGFFEIPNLPAETEFYIYGIMQSLQGKGAIPVRTVHTGQNEERIEVGSLEVEPGFSVSGQVVLSDGSAIPPKTRLIIGRDDAWDSLFCELDKDGWFTASDLPPGAYGINVRVKGYRMSAKNYSLDPLNKFGLMGVITSNIDGLTILLEPGRANPNSRDPGAGARYRRLGNEEIRGWEKE